jgi:methyltransferase
VNVTPAELFVGVILLQRLVELWLAHANARHLLEAGGVEHGADHYHRLVIMHGAVLFVLAYQAPSATLHPWFAAAYLTVLPLRAWSIASLGRFWTTRVITLPGAAPVARGPYRWTKHPIYVVVALELGLAPLALGLWWLALAATIANALLMRERLRVENAALAALATAPSSPRRP